MSILAKCLNATFGAQSICQGKYSDSQLGGVFSASQDIPSGCSSSDLVFHTSSWPASSTGGRVKVVDPCGGATTVKVYKAASPSDPPANWTLVASASGVGADTGWFATTQKDYFIVVDSSCGADSVIWTDCAGISLSAVVTPSFSGAVSSFTESSTTSGANLEWTHGANALWDYPAHSNAAGLTPIWGRGWKLGMWASGNSSGWSG